MKYFSPATGLPSHKDTGIGEVAIRETNGSMKSVLEKQSDQTSAKKWKLYTFFSVTDKAKTRIRKRALFIRKIDLKLLKGQLKQKTFFCICYQILPFVL